MGNKNIQGLRIQGDIGVDSLSATTIYGNGSNYTTLLGNTISTGLYEYTGLTKTSDTTFNISPAKGWVINNTYANANSPIITNVIYSGATGQTTPYLSGANATYILLTSGATISMQTAFPTSQQRKEQIFLGKIAHPNRTSIQNTNNTVDYDVSPMSAIRDIFTPIKLINDGVVVSPNGANLNINTSAGKLYGMGVNWVTNQLAPNEVTITATTATSFFYKTQTGSTTSLVTAIDPTIYDNNGVLTTISATGDGGGNKSTNQRIYLYPTGVINIQYGQKVYDSLALALAGQQSESFVKYSEVTASAILIGILAVRRTTSNLNNTAYAVFAPASIFGESIGGVNGISTTTLQQAYNNSTTPEIIIDSTLDGFTIQNGTGNADNVTNLLEGKNTAGDTTSYIRADGTISASTIIGDTQLETVYLTYDGVSGTTTGTKGCILTSPGNWTITKFNTVYFCDDAAGNITITIPDASNNNEGKTLIVVKPRLVTSANYITIKTTTNQAVAETTTFYLKSSNDRAELISVPFLASGATGYKYRVTMINRSVPEVIEVSPSGTQLFSDIKSAVDFCNAYADSPKRIKVNPGTYLISSTITINCPYPLVIEGYGTEITTLSATTSMSATPMFDIITKCDFKGFTAKGLSGLTSINDQCCLDCGTDGLYFEVHNVAIDGFYKGLELEGNSEFWVFDSIIQNCVSGLWSVGGNLGGSELTLKNNLNAIYYSAATTASTFSIQNTIFNVNSGQIGIVYKDDIVTPKYLFATSNAFYGDGTYISGLTFTSKTQSDIRVENNLGLADYKPSVYLWVSGNTSATTITTGVYVKPNILATAIQAKEQIKFSDAATGLTFTYLPVITRKGNCTVSGDLSCSSNNTDASVALFKNGQKLQDIDVRCSISSVPYSFAFNGINNLSENDNLEFRFTKTSATSSNLTLRTLMMVVTT